MVNERISVVWTTLLALILLAPAAGALGGVPLLASGPDAFLRDPTSPSPAPSAAPSTPVPVYSPYGVVPQAPPVPTKAPNGFEVQPRNQAPINGPFGDLVLHLGSMKQVDAPHLAAAIADYYAALGFETPGSSAAVYDDNSTLSYTHTLGDIDGDGFTDVLLDTYCNNGNDCRPIISLTTANLPQYLHNIICQWPHQIKAVSGRSGLDIWNRTLDPQRTYGAYEGCTVDFIVGTVPDGNGHEMIEMVRWDVLEPYAFFNNFALVIKNTVSGVDGVTGKTVWSKSFDGDYFIQSVPGTSTFVMTARNMLVNPILQVPDQEPNVKLLPNGTQPGLILQGVGFNATYLDSQVANPFAVAPYTFLYEYQPDEWAMGVDPLTGAQKWIRDTFQPNGRVTSTPNTPAVTVPESSAARVPHGNRSLFPVSLQSPPIHHTVCTYDASIHCAPPPPSDDPWNTPGNDRSPQRAGMWYWGHEPCCFDVTGDGVPDLFYTVYEWSSTPMTNYEGPFDLAGRLVLMDGATGKTVYDFYPDPQVDHSYSLRVEYWSYVLSLERLGDVNGDGASDLVLHQIYYQWDFSHKISVLDGKTGKTIWSLANARQIKILPIGDATGDGSIDLALFNYTYDASFYGDRYGRSNVSWTPLRVFNGADGKLVWEHRTYMAPFDIFYTFENYRINGLADFDHDGIGDLPADDPLFLPDLSTIHRITYLSGKDAHILFKYESAGVFSFPSLVGDVNGDGTRDMFLLNGDVNDLWGTTYSGKNGTAIWSRRVTTTKNSNYFAAIPHVRTEVLHDANSSSDNYLLNFHFEVTNAVFNFQGFYQYRQTKPTLMTFGGLNGTVAWALPSLYDVNLTVVVPGASPASQRYAGSLAYNAQQDRAADTSLATPVQVIVGTGSFGSALAASFLLAGRRWKP